MGDDRKGGCFLLVDECKIGSHTIEGREGAHYEERQRRRKAKG